MRNWTEAQVTLVLIRHGATRANEERRYLGRTEEGLSPQGRAALKKDRARQRYPRLTHLFASPMKRCLETAELLYPKLLYPQLSPVVIPEWREMDFGCFEYKNYQELAGDARYQAWIDSGGTGDFPEGESRAHFQKRCKQGFARMCRELQRLQQQEPKEQIHAGLIVHGGTIMTLVSVYEGGGYFDYQVPNGGGYVCSLLGSWDEPGLLREEAL